MAGTVPKDIRGLRPKRLGRLAPSGTICPQYLDERDDKAIPV